MPTHFTASQALSWMASLCAGIAAFAIGYRNSSIIDIVTSLGRSKNERLQRCIAGAVRLTGGLLVGTSLALAAVHSFDAAVTVLKTFGANTVSLLAFGAWLQVMGTLSLAIFTISVIHFSGAWNSIAGWPTFLGVALLAATSLIEWTVVLSGYVFARPEAPSFALQRIVPVQYLWLCVAAPFVLLTIGVVILRCDVLPRVFGAGALFLRSSIAIAGLAYSTERTLPIQVVMLTAAQASW